MKVILQKIISNSGYCSRRQAEELIRNGRIKINNHLAELGERADPDKDTIIVNNRPLLTNTDKIYIKLNKPSGYTCTNRNFKNEKNIFNLIDIKERLFTVGRLDKNSRGLILLTNDGDLAQRLTHPKFQHQKLYEVKVIGEIKNLEEIKKSFIKGVRLEKTKEIGRAKNIEYLQNKIFIISLTEGKKRQIRRMFKTFNLEVKDLKRLSIATLKLGDLKEGHWQYLSSEEKRELKIK